MVKKVYLIIYLNTATAAQEFIRAKTFEFENNNYILFSCVDPS